MRNLSLKTRVRPPLHNHSECQPHIDSSRPIIFMKVGPHSGFTLDEILQMKIKEENACGRFFWGYGGTLCHPRRVVDFAENSLKEYGVLPLIVMSSTNSKYSSEIGRNSTYSLDGHAYRKLSREVTMIGCKFAIVAKELKRVAIDIDLNNYSVANGKRQGRLLGDFIKYQVNKSCAMPLPTSSKVHQPHRIVKIVSIAEIIKPFCVYLK